MKYTCVIKTKMKYNVYTNVPIESPSIYKIKFIYYKDDKHNIFNRIVIKDDYHYIARGIFRDNYKEDREMLMLKELLEGDNLKKRAKYLLMKKLNITESQIKKNNEVKWLKDVTNSINNVKFEIEIQ